MNWVYPFSCKQYEYTTVTRLNLNLLYIVGVLPWRLHFDLSSFMYVDLEHHYTAYSKLYIFFSFFYTHNCGFSTLIKTFFTHLDSTDRLILCRYLAKKISSWQFKPNAYYVFYADSRFPTFSFYLCLHIKNLNLPPTIAYPKELVPPDLVAFLIYVVFTDY